MAYHRDYSEDEILEGFRKGNAFFFREYFYEYCRVAYNIYDQRYGLSRKENLDFMSLAHQYALYLMEHDWRPLEDHSPQVSLRTWMVNGFRYIVLDALKWYQREYGSISFDDYLRSFDTSADLRLQFNRIVNEVCDKCLNRKEAELVRLLLVEGYPTKEVAEMKGVTPSAVSQQYKNIRERVIEPYLRQHFDMELDMPEVMVLPNIHEEYGELARHHATTSASDASRFSIRPKGLVGLGDSAFSIGGEGWGDSADYSEDYTAMETKRTTPDYITELAPNEIFVFGSNLRGMHGGGAAWVAYRNFGAVMGQGVGLQGQSYAIPTMQGGVETIRPYVDEFIQFAKAHPDLTFLVTRIGCGIAGFRDSDIAPLFKEAHGAENIVLPEGW